MAEKYFMHRIQEENGAFSVGIEVHDTKNSAIRSFWGRMKTAYGNNPNITFVHCKITDKSGHVIGPYDMAWNTTEGNKFFLHHIRGEGESYTKGIDVLESFDAARSAYAEQMEYGYNNSKFPNVDIVSCEITDKSGSVMLPFRETWTKESVEEE